MTLIPSQESIEFGDTFRAMQAMIDQQREENERLKGLIEKAFFVTNYDGKNQQEAWQQFKTDNHIK